jgi:hypothetical protein
MAEQLGHEGLAKAHDFVIGLAFGVEVRAALAAAHRKPGKAVLEGLLEGQELEHAQGHARVKADTALVGADRVVVLDPIAAVDAVVTLVVLPAYAEDYDAVGLGDAAQNLRLVVALLVVDIVEHVVGDLVDRLMELGLTRIALLYAIHEFVEGWWCRHP